MTRTLIRSALITTAALSLVLSGCAQNSENRTTQSQETTAPDAAEQSPLSFDQAWVKATDTTMTGAFAQVMNNTDADVTITGASTEVAGMVELHETAADGSGGMSMQEKEGGFTVPAHGSLTLEPGGDHIMLMELTTAVEAGDTVTLTVVTDAGDIEVELTAKEFSGAQENYAPGDHGPTGGQDQPDSTDHSESADQAVDSEESVG